MTNGENCVMLYKLFKRFSKASQNVGNILQAQSLSDTSSWWGLMKYRAGLNSATCILNHDSLHVCFMYCGKIAVGCPTGRQVGFIVKLYTIKYI